MLLWDVKSICEAALNYVKCSPYVKCLQNSDALKPSYTLFWLQSSFIWITTAARKDLGRRREKVLLGKGWDSRQWKQGMDSIIFNEKLSELSVDVCW